MVMNLIKFINSKFTKEELQEIETSAVLKINYIKFAMQNKKREKGFEKEEPNQNAGIEKF